MVFLFGVHFVSFVCLCNERITHHGFLFLRERGFCIPTPPLGNRDSLYWGKSIRFFFFSHFCLGKQSHQMIKEWAAQKIRTVFLYCRILALHKCTLGDGRESLNGSFFPKKKHFLWTRGEKHPRNCSLWMSSNFILPLHDNMRNEWIWSACNALHVNGRNWNFDSIFAFVVFH